MKIEYTQPILSLVEETEISKDNIQLPSAELTKQQEQVAGLSDKLSSYQAEMLQLSQLLSAADYEVAQKRAMLQWIVNSRSWKATSWMRALKFLGQRVRTSSFEKSADFIGELEHPAVGSRVSRFVDVSGWVHSSVARVEAVEVFLDSVPLGTLAYGQFRPDVSAYPSQAPVNCGYHGKVLIDDSFAGWRNLVVRVQGRRGKIKDYQRRILVEAPFRPMSARALTPEDEQSSLAALLRDDLSIAQRLQTSLAKISLQNFLVSNSVVEFPHCAEPEVSIVVVLYNRAELSLQCLYSILRSNNNSCEVVIVDNASTDETGALLKRIKGAQIIRNEQNLHYIRACNQASRQAKGKYLLFVNNDTQLEPHSISSALQTLKSSDDIGAVGGRITLADGNLQEAGSIIWRDGSCLGYGRGESSLNPPFMFKRDVDYCSAVFLMTRRDLFLAGGGFDNAYLPAYCEDTDYCARLWQKGKRVVYDPDAVVVHHEFASSASRQAAIDLQARHQELFASRHSDWLQQQHPPQNALAARTHRRNGAQRILVLDDRVPHVSLGSGFPRSNGILRHFVELGHHVTCYPLTFIQEDWTSVYEDIPREVEVMVGYGLPELEKFLSDRMGFYDVLFVSRPHNLENLRVLMRQKPHLFRGIMKIYDAEALVSLRDIERKLLKGTKVCAQERQQLVEKEVELAGCCDRVVSVSDQESREFSRYGLGHVSVLGHALRVLPTPNGFADRKDLLFVGAIHEHKSPNADSVLWFSRKILPRVQRLLGYDVNLSIAGVMPANIEEGLDRKSIEVKGVVKDLSELYNQHRIFIAPTRFSAGIPLKILEAAAYGVPVVATSIVGRKLGWTGGHELLLADDENAFAQACARLYRDPELWNYLRENAFSRVAREYSPEAFSEQLRTIIEPTEESNNGNCHYPHEIAVAVSQVSR